MSNPMSPAASDPSSDALDVVEACRSLGALERPVKRLLAGGLAERRYADGEVMLAQDRPGTGLFIVAEGEADVLLRDESGASRELARVGVGEVFGEMSLLTKQPATADVVARGPVRTLHIGTEDFERIAREHPELGIVLTYLIGERLGENALDGLGGKTIDRYRIDRCVGRGAMAVVYRAREAGGEHPVALKMMSHRLVYEDGAMQRFQTEADILMSLQHDNIARLHRRFDAFNTCFLAMEYCDGEDLQQVVNRRGALPESEVRKIIGHLAAALRHLHEGDVVHGDLKPSNVMTTSRGEVKLTDFGLATKACQPNAADARSSLGTPLYMSPEQLDGAPPCPSSDLYALGCVILELATGEKAFSAESLSDLLSLKRGFKLPPAREIGTGLSCATCR
ncbi:MAG: protein kinase domain-containing protein [Planctomycetota bacterium]|jgi:CRP-like cAMP-binding protein